MRVVEASADESALRFEVYGSRTGPDGGGVSNERFVSRSGRVVIEPDDWGVKRAFDLRHICDTGRFRGSLERRATVYRQLDCTAH